MLEQKLKAIQEKYDELSLKIADSSIIADQKLWQRLMKEHSDLEPIIFAYKEYSELKSKLKDAREIIADGDKDLIELAKLDEEEANARLPELENEIKILLLPKDPNDDKNVVMEIRAGAGGDESSLFASDLLRMYQMYCDEHGYKIETLSLNSNGLGGIKEIAINISGNGAYSDFKYESGVHRVQRVPTTESSGRIHTSTTTVAVLPEIDEVEVDINQNDLRIDVFRAGGPGGQCVNTTDSAVRITHLPTGIVVSCQDEKSQHKNKDKAMKVLRSRIYEVMQERQHAEMAADRKSQVGTGERSERIRTYNFPQGRMTDHRIGLTLYKLEAIMNGDIEEIIQALRVHYQTLALTEDS